MRCGMILKCVEGRMVYFPKKMTFSDSMKGRNFPTRSPIMNSRRAMSQGVVISNLQENCQIASNRGCTSIVELFLFVLNDSF